MPLSLPNSSCRASLSKQQSPPTLGSYTFDNNASGRKIYVPADSVNVYKEESGWDEYAADIEPMQSSALLP